MECSHVWGGNGGRCCSDLLADQDDVLVVRKVDGQPKIGGVGEAWHTGAEENGRQGQRALRRVGVRPPLLHCRAGQQQQQQQQQQQSPNETKDRSLAKATHIRNS